MVNTDITGQNRTLANIMKDYYISFAVHLDPNAESYTGSPKPCWQNHLDSGKRTFSIMQVNETELAQRPDPDAAPQCDFWQANSYIVRN